MLSSLFEFGPHRPLEGLADIELPHVLIHSDHLKRLKASDQVIDHARSSTWEGTSIRQTRLRYLDVSPSLVANEPRNRYSSDGWWWFQAGIRLRKKYEGDKKVPSISNLNQPVLNESDRSEGTMTDRPVRTAHHPSSVRKVCPP